MALVYRITCITTGKVYIGWTVQPLEQRWKRHLRLDKKSYLVNCIRTYGADAFRLEVVADGLEADQAKAMEVIFIKELRLNMCRHPDGPGMNMTDGGEGTIGYVATESHRRNISAAQKGLKRTAAACAAISLSKQGEKNPMFGRPKTPEQLEIARQLFLSNNPHKPGRESHRFGKPSHMRGRKHTEESKRKMSDKQIGRPKPKRTEATRQKLRENTIRYIQENGHPGLGKKRTQESRERMRQARLTRLAKDAEQGITRCHSPETIEKMKAAARKRVDRQRAERALTVLLRE